MAAAGDRGQLYKWQGTEKSMVPRYPTIKIDFSNGWDRGEPCGNREGVRLIPDDDQGSGRAVFVGSRPAWKRKKSTIKIVLFLVCKKCFGMLPTRRFVDAQAFSPCPYVFCMDRENNKEIRRLLKDTGIGSVLLLGTALGRLYPRDLLQGPAVSGEVRF